MKNNFHEYDPRHRLTGAVVLILLAIILLPMLLSKKQEIVEPETDPVVMEITKDGKKVFVSRISSVSPASSTSKSDKELPAGTKPATAVQGSSDSTPSALFRPLPPTAEKRSSSTEKPAAAKSTKTSSEKKPVAKKTTSKKAASAKTTEKKSVPVTSGWILQIGVFSQSENAAKKVSELKKKGFNATSGKVKTSKGTVTKVWIGPFKDRKSAEKMQDRLQHKTRQRGIVVENKS
ncbi:MAG: SPOR domain-containing protein [Arenicellales bacterium]